MAIYSLIFNEIDGEYKVINHNGHVIWNADTADECLQGAADWIGCKPEDIEVAL